jgi:formylglycine-generating enzyme required for sulfatase activity
MRRLRVVCLGVGLLAWAGYAQSPPALSVQVSNRSVRLRIAGDVGSACTIQWASSLYGGNNWQFLTNLTPLSSSPYVVADTNVVTAPRFYRAFAQQVRTNVVTTNMVWIPPGTFVMGSPTNEAERQPNGWDETQHTVTISRGFWMGKYLVTQGDYVAVVGSNPSICRNGIDGTNSGGTGGPITNELIHPVEHVSWYDVSNYCALRTQQERAGGLIPTNYAYRLPTESEWEYACRAGTTTAFNFGSAIHGGMANFYDYHEYDASIGEIHVANPAVPRLPRTTTVGSYQPNAWGLYDMHGNLWEWCRDWYDTYPTGSVTDPQGPPSGWLWKVVRGGEWGADGGDCRSARRGYVGSGRFSNNGFRVVLAPGQP